ncbi:DUF502 domain-containing protein [Alienimonas californiensis]|uniref:DUF502 domain-containing protein n=1 Tax=Alienimonas californiensis TaxID=2527989 RepID=A0A517PA75_9PLAN|nr:DUF502 domain-containing protein [Alienimonas californiensis]QDT16269.1 hypothetical protein CA12_23700 [Alienimonas californiensis]
MSHPASSRPETPVASPPHRRGVGAIFLRGLAITLPSILTVAILLWAAGTVMDYVVNPVSAAVRYSIGQAIRADVPAEGLIRPADRPELDFAGTSYVVRPDAVEKLAALDVDGRVLTTRDLAAAGLADDVFVRMSRRRAVPYRDYELVARGLPADEMPGSATGLYAELATERYFRSSFLLSALAVALALLAIYFIGRLVGVRLGAWFVKKIEDDVLGKLPVVSRVYGSVKQVTDFLFAERQIEYNSVVAVEYPLEGVWSIGFVTGEGMRETVEAAGEPLYSILMPTSPMPMTGFTISAPRSKVRELDLTVEQAFQFCLSCGVLVPPQQALGPQARINGTPPGSAAPQTIPAPMELMGAARD